MQLAHFRRNDAEKSIMYIGKGTSCIVGSEGKMPLSDLLICFRKIRLSSRAIETALNKETCRQRNLWNSIGI